MIELQMAMSKNLIAQLEKTNVDLEKAIQQTLKDCKTRAPAQVTQAVTAVYNIKSSEVSAAGKSAKSGAKTVGSVKLAGHTVGTLQFIYEGRRLTPTHFSMSPKSKPAGKKRYTVKATFYKGQKKTLQGKAKYGTPVFLAPQAQGVILPFQRMGEKRLPVYGIHSTSIPQMIENETVADDLQKRLDDLFVKRLQHNVDRLANK